MTFPSPPPVDLPRGTTCRAGLSLSTVLPDLDFETYSEAGYLWSDETGRWEGPPGAPKQTRGLPLVGAEPYVKHPTFRIIWMAYDLKDGRGKHRWHPGMQPPLDLFEYLTSGGPIEAWNVGFERWVWELHCVSRLGWPVVREDQWRCAMAKARAFALPGKLEKTGEVLGLPIQKDKAGSALMRQFSMPRQPTKNDPRRHVRPVYTEEDLEVQAIIRYGQMVRAAGG